MDTRLASTWALIVSMLLGCFQTAAIANEIKYTAPSDDKPGAFSGQLPLGSLGSVFLPRGMVMLETDEFKVLAVPQWLFDRNLVFRGAIVRAEAVSQANSLVIGGLVYFYDGQWLANLGSADSIDVIETLNGVQARGHIVGRAGETFVFRREDGGTQNIEFTAIKSISSPRAFTFKIASPNIKVSSANTTVSFDSNLIVMNSTRQPNVISSLRRPSVPVSKLPGTEKAISNRALATFIALDIMTEMAPAIAIPLVVNKRNTRAAQNELSRFLQNSNLSSSSSVQPPSSTLSSPSGP
ncbi:MAG TPA: hypothetical protein V6C86_10280 [Oculatellaceae cyanobacterium]|jgi:hypothetical protein